MAFSKLDGKGIDLSSNVLTSFASTGIDDNATSTALTIASNGNATFGGEVDAGESRFLKPSTFWTGSTAFFGHNYGSVATQGNFDFHLTANGYRNSSGTWTSLAVNSKTGAAQIALDPDGQIGFNTDATKANGDSYLVTRRMTIDADGLKFGTDTAAANALNDYEEGTWTPTITGYTGGSTQAYSNQTGIYRKIGNLVYVSYRITLTSKGNMSGNYILLQGLPYNIGGTSITPGYGGIAYFSGLNQAVTSLFWELGAGTNNSFWLIYITGTSAYGSSYMPVSGIGNSFYMTGSAVYYTA